MDGRTQFHVMLSSLLDNIRRQPANIGLTLVGIRELPNGCGESIEQEFSRLI